MVRYGLLETRSQVVPLHRVQSIGVTWPLLWRGQAWLHLRLDIAGYAGPQADNDKRSDRLLPVGDLGHRPRAGLRGAARGRPGHGSPPRRRRPGRAG